MRASKCKNLVFWFGLNKWVCRLKYSNLCILINLILVIGGFQSLHSEELPSEYQVHIRSYSVPLYLSPDKKSEVIAVLPYGHSVNWDGEYLLDPSKQWIPVKEKNGLAGFLMRSQTIVYKRQKRFEVLSKEVDRQIQFISSLKKEADVTNSRLLESAIQLTDFLFDSVSEANYSGDQFLYLKARAGESLAITAIHINERDHVDFISRYNNFMTKVADSESSIVRLDQNYFWKYASLYQNLKSGQLSAELAIEYTPDPNCDKEPSCYLEYLTDTYLRYLLIYPFGRKSKSYQTLVTKLLNDYTRDFDQVRCFPPSPPSMYKKIEDFKNRMKKILDTYSTKDQITDQSSRSFKNKYPWYVNWKLSIQKIEKECFPRI
ncbi:SH3 domain-containing protein [Leptospira sp. GIMC2001]|uniref:SH3 domain-containing protein n=1 Tax=Leptospira sp. GIMC2001 TaxID=1513297 RepID=UPI00234A3F2B|nr:SH3 domain-containing protein [Leptospira sp. GIMC2001]WCL50225.1 SH3 domain-containing protein [Leptospira sp. GIMC2001]